MARPARSESEIQEDKNKIIRIALELLHSDGFALLSMRKIASRMGMTAPNIYNYFANKDELNIEMRRYGFVQLYEQMKSAYESGSNIREKLRNFIKAYVSFGLKDPYFYELMFDMPTPKYSDYVGTPMEEIAHRELLSSMRVLLLVHESVLEFNKAGGTILADQITNVMFVWSALHGMVSLFNNKLLVYLSPNAEKMVDDASDLLLQLINLQLNSKVL